MRRSKVFVARYAGRCGCGCGAEVLGQRVIKTVTLADCAFPKRAKPAEMVARFGPADAAPMRGGPVVLDVPAVPASGIIGPSRQLQASELGKVTEIGTDERPADAGLVMDPECGIRPPGLDPDPDEAERSRESRRGFTFRTLPGVEV